MYTLNNNNKVNFDRWNSICRTRSCCVPMCCHQLDIDFCRDQKFVNLYAESIMLHYNYVIKKNEIFSLNLQAEIAM